MLSVSSVSDELLEDESDLLVSKNDWDLWD